MYKLVRVEDQFRVIERSASADAAAINHVSEPVLQESLSQLWSPCTQMERQFWNDFVRKGSVETPPVRRAILESWERCKNAGVEFDEGKCRDFISDRDLEERKGLLREISEPIMETLHQCVRGSGFVIVLVDTDGYILASLGDLVSIRQAEKLNFGPGANWSEHSVGTNAIGTALTIGCPIEVTGAEHYCETHHLWTCAAAPIRDPQGGVVGCLDMSGPREKAHFHSLGITVAAVRAIEERLQLEQSHKYYVSVSKHLATIFNSVSEGLITIDNKGLITGINAPAARLLMLHPRDLVGRSIDDVLRMDRKLNDFLHGSREYSEEELLLKSQRTYVRCVGSANSIISEDGSKLGAVFTFTKVRQASSQPGARHESDSRFMFKDIIGESLTMRDTLEKAKKVAKSPSTVLILGESGTGKELFAQAIHNASDRRDGPFVSVNCGAIPAELIQSELFGYVEGAFTGAKKGGRLGKLELANGGSIFLDEIGDMPLEMQVNLLRVLEGKAIVRVGDNKMIPVNVRIIAATNRSLYDEVSKGRFREDLFYRLNVVAITIPPLRDRKGDVRLLTNHYIETISRKVGKNVESMEPAIYGVLEAYHWPGNVRELANAIEYAVNLLQGEELKLSHLPPHLKRKEPVRTMAEDTEIMPLALVEKKAIEDALIHFGGNITKVSNALGIGRNTLYDKMKKYGIRSLGSPHSETVSPEITE
ncbi:sigma-54-dependent Fis family transcriptional regulator [Desulfomonile tiedjei]|uniref:Transcriptional activator of acetoin/glycerol metabolism n=1 Tax=Desulfomonile tiedjei (strain ATCC 49306 / DSM 6799 / DCB-1) TaxID=706587 RepID=I4C1M8_DESTA|nr:sigma-54-dependent Fis family transcriptional regulator [Desulfomonile tiedjei]AFM23469.1 transcriptional activator of acetoin/glycerol metabolism [Desulfomonile tiedjei DSM 6799]